MLIYWQATGWIARVAEWSNAAGSVIYGTRSGQLCKKNSVFFKQIERLSLLVEYGEMAEWSNAADSKSVVRFFRTVSSNLTLSAIR